MSKYTTGELAKLCDVTVRTVQFYDAKHILIPSELTEGGRRLYSDDDLENLKLICLLKSLSLSLDSIKEILESENQNKILNTLLTEQARQIKLVLSEKENQLIAIDLIIKNITAKVSLPLNLITDIDTMMKEKNKLKSAYVKMSIIAMMMGAIEISTIFYGFTQNNWTPFAFGLVVVVVLSLTLLKIYYTDTMYICPNCSKKFKPVFREFLFASHTLKTRKLTCTHCGMKEFCIETSSDALH